jgi:biotin carboxylase
MDSPHEEQAFDAATELVESIAGLKGYVGVDLILTKKDPIVIEVNPRLTTSYVGTRKVLNLNFAQTIIDSTLEQKLPAKQETTSYAYFEKVKTLNPANAALQQTFNMPEVVSPPFPTGEGSYTYALICSQGSTSLQAKRNFNKAEKYLNKILLTGGKQER